MAEKVLVTGGAGYVGSQVALALIDAGHGVIVLDDLSTGLRRLVPDQAAFVEGDAGDGALVEKVIAEHDVSAVMHFAASSLVHESMAEPLAYYRNNVCAGRTLIEACVKRGVGALVFSSSAAVYGDPVTLPLTEEDACAPINPYGASKLMTEVMLRDVARVSELRHVSLRYFNVAGADLEGRSGESPPVASHLIKVACEAATGARDHIDIYGDDYDTPDGTCIRDYIHVVDLADAHLAALDHLFGGGESLTLNCGYGHGYSVRQVLDAVERATGIRLDKRLAPRRPGDPPVLVADASRIRERFGWRPKYDDLEVIVKTAYAWEQGLSGA
jgi:UDP-glucose 4-epimerase